MNIRDKCIFLKEEVKKEKKKDREKGKPVLPSTNNQIGANIDIPANTY